VIRELRSVRTEQRLGAVDDTLQGADAFTGSAGDVLSGMRRRLGDAETVRQVMRDGWSNGYLYFSDPVASPS